jgi:integrase
MRGSLKQRYKGLWSIILDLESASDPSDAGKRKQKWITFHGTKKDAEKKLNDLIGAANGDTFVEPSKLTLIRWLRQWIAGMKTLCRPTTYSRYHGLIENHIAKATIADLPLQKIRPSHLEAYYQTAAGSASSLMLQHTAIRRALRKAMRDRLVTVNVASDLEGRPRQTRGASEDARAHCWDVGEAQAFLKAAKAAGPQDAAFYSLALDSGARKGELCGLRWVDVDLEQAKIRIVQQLTTPGPVPTFGPPKNGRPRTIALSAETVSLLRVHKQAQAALKLANRPAYHDFGLVFAKTVGELFTRKDLLGQPLQANHLGGRSLERLRKVAEVRRIKFHGLRHTCATLLLRAGEPVHVVAQRLGHAGIQITLTTYAHVLPDMQQGAADRLGALLHGGR